MTEVSDEMVEAATKELLAHGEFSANMANNEPNAREAARAAITAALAARPKVRVRKLEWAPSFDEMGANGMRYTARSLVGLYIVTTEIHGQLGARWLTSFGSYHDTLDAAKAAAQANYERRILAALEDGQ